MKTMGVKRVGCVAVVTAMLWSQAGCSFMFAKGPPARHAEMASFDCSESNGWPIFDTIWAGLNGLGAISAAGDDTNPDKDQVVAVGLGWLLVSGISAIHGYSQVSDCKKAKREHEEYGAPVYTPQPVVAEACLAERARALAEARKESDKRERIRLISLAPRCEAQVPRAVYARPAAPAQPAPAAAPAAPAPAAPAARAPAAPAPAPAAAAAAPAPAVPAQPAPTSM